MGSLPKNIQLMLEFLKSTFIVIHLSYYNDLFHFSYYPTNDLMILSLILLSMLMLMILLSALNVIMHLICGHNQNWLLNLNLIYDTMWTATEGGSLISVLEKIN